MKYSISLLIFVMVAAAGCMNENPVATDTGDTSPELIPKAPKMVEFFAHQENTIIVTGGTACTLEASFPGVIEGDHIGSGTISSTSVVNFCTGVQTTEATITAANGDLLIIGVMVGSFDTTDPTNAIFWGDFTITGGTGRFDGASGSGMYAGTADTIAGVGQYDFDGVISR
jgi:hypothetical protein